MRLSGFFQLDSGIYSQNTLARAYFGDMLNGVGFRRARLQAIGKVTETNAFSIEMDLVNQVSQVSLMSGVSSQSFRI